MKMLFFCNECEIQGLVNYEFNEIESSNEGLYEFVCKNGHDCRTFLQEKHFEILFDSGAMALLDGYPREAVVSLAAALERFYEYCIKIFLERGGIEYEEYSNTWKMVQNQSERQIGAFLFLFLKEFKKAPFDISNVKIGNGKRRKKIVEFRNDVIHKGDIPKSDEVMEYGKQLYDYMISILKILKKDYETEMRNINFRRQKIVSEKSKGTGMYSVMSVATLMHLSLALEIFGQDSFEKSLESLKQRMAKFYKKG